jgi:serine/threonine-protein kinase RsbW
VKEWDVSGWIDSDQLADTSQLRPDDDEISLRVPALRRYVSAVRSMSTALAVQCGLTVDEIEDVQMSIDEACSLLLPHVSRSRAWLDLSFHLVEGRFAAAVSVAVASPVELEKSSLAWTVLSALCDEVDVASDGRTLTISLTKLSEVIRP